MLFHLGVILVGLIGLYMAIIFDGDIKNVWKTLGSYSAACLLLPVLLGHIFPRQVSDRQFMLTCSISALFVTLWRISERSGIYAEIAPLYAGILTTMSIMGLCFLYNWWHHHNTRD